MYVFHPPESGTPGAPLRRKSSAPRSGFVQPPASGKGAEAVKVAALVLVKWLHRPEAPIRRAALGGLAEIGKPAQPAVPALLAALDDKDGEIRELAARALKSIDIEAAAKAGV